MKLACQEFQGFSYVIQICPTSDRVLASPNFIVHLIAHRSDSGSYKYIGQQHFLIISLSVDTNFVGSVWRNTGNSGTYPHLRLSPDRAPCHFSSVLALPSITPFTHPHSEENKKFSPSLDEKQAGRRMSTSH